MQANIERFAKNKSIFTPAQWYKEISDTLPGENKFEVVEMASKFANFHKLATQHWKWTGYAQVKWTKLREIISFSDTPGKLSVRHSLLEEVQPIYINAHCS